MIYCSGIPMSFSFCSCILSSMVYFNYGIIRTVHKFHSFWNTVFLVLKVNTHGSCTSDKSFHFLHDNSYWNAFQILTTNFLYPTKVLVIYIFYNWLFSYDIKSEQWSHSIFYKRLYFCNCSLWFLSWFACFIRIKFPWELMYITS